jgi:hypothetical protein
MVWQFASWRHLQIGKAMLHHLEQKTLAGRLQVDRRSIASPQKNAIAIVQP